MTKKKCNKGWGCGGACISRKKTCKSNLDISGKKLVEDFTQYLQRMSAEDKISKTVDTVQRGDQQIERAVSSLNLKGLRKKATQQRTIQEALKNVTLVTAPKVSTIIPEEDKFTFRGKDINLRELAEADKRDSPETIESTLNYYRGLRDKFESGELSEDNIRFELDNLQEQASRFGVAVQRDLQTVLEREFNIDTSSLGEPNFNESQDGWEIDQRIPKDLFTNSDVVGAGSFGVFVDQNGQGYKIETEAGYDNEYFKTMERGVAIQQELADQGLAPNVDYVAKGPQGTAVVKQDFLKGYRDFSAAENIDKETLEKDLLPKVKEALEKMKELNISHNDFNAGNIMYNPETNDIKIIDFTGATKDSERFNQYDMFIEQLEALL